jgi:hypothetical protein
MSAQAPSNCELVIAEVEGNDGRATAAGAQQYSQTNHPASHDEDCFRRREFGSSHSMEANRAWFNESERTQRNAVDGNNLAGRD